MTLIGHASLVFEPRGGIVLMDPVFFDPFEGGVVASCPEREVSSWVDHKLERCYQLMETEDRALLD